jgi:hypothetical protein
MRCHRFLLLSLLLGCHELAPESASSEARLELTPLDADPSRTRSARRENTDVSFRRMNRFKSLLPSTHATAQTRASAATFHEATWND